ncbi:hypothetical protein I2486_02980 [Cellulophaga sp. E16_2]|uniref:hypothetical protein n=1 Tax=Cellulophaga sp. E16_2 TaxID=2789297 RepID=UPI001A93A766|nr:hypothetical protein [Cellulophaga sp. E16_2]MBO0590360.1 hypothetical protein [Cellulophaga sp. E16_2]
MIKIIFITITLLSLVLFYLGTGKIKKILIISILWLSSIGTLSFYSYFENTTTTPPRFLIVLIGSISLSIYLLKTLRIKKINTKMILVLHSLRLPIEICLLQLYFQNQIPKLMTFLGYNFDIIMGISAIIILLSMHYKKSFHSNKILYYWNITGLIFLSIIVLTALLSAPLPFQLFAFNQPNIALTKFPFVFLPAFIVPLIYTSHFLTLKTLKNAS